jgi:hypothetical protein
MSNEIDVTEYIISSEAKDHYLSIVGQSSIEEDMHLDFDKLTADQSGAAAETVDTPLKKNDMTIDDILEDNGNSGTLHSVSNQSSDHIVLDNGTSTDMHIPPIIEDM